MRKNDFVLLLAGVLLIPLLAAFLSISFVSVVVTLERITTPTSTQENPRHHVPFIGSSHNSFPYTALLAKLAAVDSDVPATLPESFIPFKKLTIMYAFVTIMATMQAIRIGSTMQSSQ